MSSQRNPSPYLESVMTTTADRPAPRGLYDPRFEHDSCGVSFVADIKGRASHDLVLTGLRALTNLEHRGATGAEPDTSWELPEARARAEEFARAAAEAEAVAAGASDHEVEITWSENVIEVDGRPMFVEGTATAIASGRPDLG